jgi:hypothetical protein
MSVNIYQISDIPWYLYGGVVVTSFMVAYGTYLISTDQPPQIGEQPIYEDEYPPATFRGGKSNKTKKNLRKK